MGWTKLDTAKEIFLKNWNIGQNVCFYWMFRGSTGSGPVQRILSLKFVGPVLICAAKFCEAHWFIVINYQGKISLPPFSAEVQIRELFLAPSVGFGWSALFQAHGCTEGWLFWDASFMGWDLLFDSSSWGRPWTFFSTPVDLKTEVHGPYPQAKQAPELPWLLWLPAFTWIFKFGTTLSFSVGTHFISHTARNGQVVQFTFLHSSLHCCWTTQPCCCTAVPERLHLSILVLWGRYL